VQVTCECGCGKVFEGQRRSARFASATCRKRASRAPKDPAARPKRPAGKATPAARETPAKTPKAAPVSKFEVATRQELDKIGQADSMLGQQVLIVARRMSSGAETGSALATLSKEHSRLMATLGAGAKAQVDPVDEVSRRREEKRARATAR
jgi:hypothetical protein